MNLTIGVNTLTEDYCPKISAAFATQGWQKPEGLYLRYFQEIKQGSLVFLLAEVAGDFAGYVTVVWDSDYPPFKQAEIPEIVDFNVIKEFQKRGIGTALMDEAERIIRSRSKVAGIGVGLYADYGPAQRLYIKRGYIPDGRGLSQAGKFLTYGDQATINHDLALYFTKIFD